MDKMPISLITTIKPNIESVIRKLQDLDMRTIQFLCFPGDVTSVQQAAAIKGALDDAGITVSIFFCTYEDEDYGTIQRGRETGGLVPPATRQARIQSTKRLAEYAVTLGAPAIGMHFGCIPEKPGDPEYGPVISAAQQVCDLCAAEGLAMHLETGEDTVETLLRFLEDVDRPNLYVNFDPANMFLYGRGEPLPALRAVGKYVKSCHCKDAIPSDEPMVIWGREVPLGEGRVNIEQFVRTLDEIGYDGPLSIEREIEGEQQIIDIKKGIEVLKRAKSAIGVTSDIS